MILPSSILLSSEFTGSLYGYFGHFGSDIAYYATSFFFRECKSCPAQSFLEHVIYAYYVMPRSHALYTLLLKLSAG